MAFFEDQLLIIGLLFMVFLGAIIGIVIVTQINSGFQSALVDSQAKTIVGSWDNQIPSILDWIFGLAFIGLPIIAMGLAFVNHIPSFFFWLASLLSFVMSIIGFAVQLLHEQMVSSQLFLDAASRIPVINFFMENMGYYIIVVWLMLALGTYVKTSQTQGAGF